jgi:transposase
VVTSRRAQSFFAEPPWNTESPQWLALDSELDPSHPVREIARLTDAELKLDPLAYTYSGRGTRPHRPDLLFKLALYEHSLGRVQPVQWKKDLEENKPIQWLVFGLRPSQTTLYEFRDRAAPFLRDLNRQVVQTAIAEGHTDGSCGALDGTTVAANATRHRMVNLATVEKRLEILEREIAEAEGTEERQTLESSPGNDGAPPSAPVAENGTKPPSWKAKTIRGKKRQRDRCRRAQAVLKAQHTSNARRRKDKRKADAKIKVALGDPMAPFGLDKLKTYRPLYNIQTVSDVQTDLVLAYATTRTVADSGQLLPMIERTMEITGRPVKEILVDSGYPSGAELAQCAEKGVTVYAPWNENAFTEAKRAKGGEKHRILKDRFTFDPSLPGYRCPEGKQLTYRERTTKQKADGCYFTVEIYQADPADCAACPLKAACVQSRSGARTVRRQENEEAIEELQNRMKTPEAKARYRQRCCTIERRFADLKTHRGFQRFSGQTPERADAQGGFTILAHNLRTLAKLRTKRGQQPVPPAKIAS